MQVYCGNRRVGKAHLRLHPGQNAIRIPIINPPSFAEPGTVPAFAPVREFQLKVDHAFFQVDDKFEHLYGPEHLAEVFKRHGVTPEECQSEQRFEMSATIYRYKVLRVDKDLLEEIFDFDWFEPADTAPDRDLLAARPPWQIPH